MQNVTSLRDTVRSYLVPLDAGQRGPAVGLVVVVTVGHVCTDHRAGPSAPFKHRHVSCGGAALLTQCPGLRQQPIRIPRQQDPQHSQQVRHVRSPRGAHFVQRKHRESPENTEDQEEGDALVQASDHECASGHAHEQEHGRAGSTERCMCPIQKRAQHRLRQVPQRQQRESSVQLDLSTEQEDPQPEEGTQEAEERRERAPATLEQLRHAAPEQVKGRERACAVLSLSPPLCTSEQERDARTQTPDAHCHFVGTPESGQGQPGTALLRLSGQRGSTCFHSRVSFTQGHASRSGTLLLSQVQLDGSNMKETITVPGHQRLVRSSCFMRPLFPSLVLAHLCLHVDRAPPGASVGRV
uniref:Uncharacterized protein n=1 Tax=Knipowitschia caucasica TaxID=637954 RepID=A0AAV2KY00_KNICA